MRMSTSQRRPRRKLQFQLITSGAYSGPAAPASRLVGASVDDTIIRMDGARLREILERLDQALGVDTVLDLHGGAAVLLLGMPERTTLDIDVLPFSRFEHGSLRRACQEAGVLFEPLDAEDLEKEYLEIIPTSTLVLPEPDPESRYDTVFHGKRLTVRTPPPADLVIGKLRRLEPDDLSDIAFLVGRFSLCKVDLESAFARLSARLRRDPVILDNFRYLLEDHFGGG